jgi:hypothetical protein
MWDARFTGNVELCELRRCQQGSTYLRLANSCAAVSLVRDLTSQDIVMALCLPDLSATLLSAGIRAAVAPCSDTREIYIDLKFDRADVVGWLTVVHAH